MVDKRCREALGPVWPSRPVRSGWKARCTRNDAADIAVR